MNKYDEIVSRAKAAYGTGAYDDATIEFLVPDVKESEDERIRKRISLCLDECVHSDIIRDYERDECLAYLEKQKDKRELDFAEGKVEGVRQTCQEIKDTMSLFEPKDLTPFEFTFRDYIDSAIRYCLAGEGYQQYIKEWAADLLNLEKQKEQKPVKLDDDTEIGLDRALQIVKAANGNLRGYQSDDGIYECCHAIQTLERILKNGIEQKPAEQLSGTFTSYDMAKTFTEGQNYVIAHPEKFGLCKPAEWSEEDEKMLNEVLDSVTYAFYNQGNEGEIEDDPAFLWLHRLRPSWKPSEDEERLINTSISFLKDFADKGYENAVECIDWLNSLRSRPHWKPNKDKVSDNLHPEEMPLTPNECHWKPSEEQMEALDKIIGYTLGDKRFYPQDLPVIHSLYDDLKELM